MRFPITLRFVCSSIKVAYEGAGGGDGGRLGRGAVSVNALSTRDTCDNAAAVAIFGVSELDTLCVECSRGDHFNYHAMDVERERTLLVSSKLTKERKE